MTSQSDASDDQWRSHIEVPISEVFFKSNVGSITWKLDSQITTLSITHPAKNLTMVQRWNITKLHRKGKIQWLAMRRPFHGHAQLGYGHVLAKPAQLRFQGSIYLYR